MPVLKKGAQLIQMPLSFFLQRTMEVARRILLSVSWSMTLICEIKFQTHAYSVPEEAYSEVVSLESLNQWSWKGAFSNDSPKRIALLGRSFKTQMLHTIE